MKVIFVKNFELLFSSIQVALLHCIFETMLQKTSQFAHMVNSLCCKFPKIDSEGETLIKKLLEVYHVVPPG